MFAHHSGADPWKEMTGSQNMQISNASQSGCNNIFPLSVSTEFPSLNILPKICTFNVSHSSGLLWRLLAVLISVSQITNEVKHLYHMFLEYLNYFMKGLFMSLAHFSMGLSHWCAECLEYSNTCLLSVLLLQTCSSALACLSILTVTLQEQNFLILRESNLAVTILAVLFF